MSGHGCGLPLATTAVVSAVDLGGVLKKRFDEKRLSDDPVLWSRAKKQEKGVCHALPCDANAIVGKACGQDVIEW